MSANKIYRVCFVAANGEAGSILELQPSVEMAISSCARVAPNCVVESVNPLFFSDEEMTDFMFVFGKKG